MTIEWLTFSELNGRLRSDYPPIGLILRPFLTAQAKSDVDLEMVGREPELEVAEADASHVWGGIAHGIPFCITASRLGSQLRFTVALPVRLRDGSRIDVALLETLRSLPVFSRFDGPYIDPLPFEGNGWAVVAAADNQQTPVFQTAVYEDAEAVAEFFTRGSDSQHAVVEVQPDRHEWIVTGPQAGAFVSRLDVTPSLESAKWLANRWSNETGAVFTIREGRVA